MSYDLAVWIGERPANDRAAAREYEERVNASEQSPRGASATWVSEEVDEPRRTQRDADGTNGSRDPDEFCEFHVSHDRYHHADDGTDHQHSSGQPGCESHAITRFAGCPASTHSASHQVDGTPVRKR